MIFGHKTLTLHPDDQRWIEEKCLDTMRQSSCSAPLPPGKKYVAVQFLTKELIFYVIDAKGKGQEIFDEASKHLGLLDAELFGLACYRDGEYIFLDLNLKLSKYAARVWKTHQDGIGGGGQPLFILHMRIKYYLDCPLLINEKVVRHHYYLQLRENLHNSLQPMSEEKSFLLAALALQADLGDYNSEKHKDRYFAVTHYFPLWIVKRVGEDFICRHIPSLHQDNAGMSRGEAQVSYMKEASDVAALHCYKVRRRKGKVCADAWLGIRDTGIYVYEHENDETKRLLATFLWCDVAKLHFEKKKFEILCEGIPAYRRFTYFAPSEQLAKYLLWLCRMTHFFHMSNQARGADLKKLQLDGGKQYRETYIYSDKFDQAREQKPVNLGGIQKMVSWTDPKENFQNISHHSLPLLYFDIFTPELKCKSQSIPCLPVRTHTLLAYNVGDESKTSWSATTPSCSRKCFEEEIPQKMYISSFVNKHVRTASVYNASSCSNIKNLSGRTVTRIGVSSLSLEQRLPLTLFDERKLLGSEPNLHSRSEMCLNVLPDEGYPFIPPPPAYRNPEKVSSQLSTSHVASVQLKDKISLNIQQLRQRSRDLDLPLISALCSDRSLLPKTVPTCSRQRHLNGRWHSCAVSLPPTSFDYQQADKSQSLPIKLLATSLCSRKGCSS